MEELKKTNPALAAADERYHRFLADEQQRALYEAREKGRRDWQSRISQAHDEGREEGREEAVREVARALKAQGMQTEMIARVTGYRARRSRGFDLPVSENEATDQRVQLRYP